MNIEEAEKYIRMMLRDNEIPDGAKTISYVYAKEAIQTLLKENKQLIHKIKTYRGMVKKQGRAISKMAEYMTTLNIDKEVCRNIQCTDGTKRIYKTCKECVVEYFTKRAEDK